MCWWSRVFQMMFHTVRVDLSERDEKKNLPREWTYPTDSFGMFLQEAQRPSKTSLVETTFVLTRHWWLLFFKLFCKSCKIHHCCCFLHFIFRLLFLCIADPGNVWLMAYKLERYTTNPSWFPAPQPLVLSSRLSQSYVKLIGPYEQ